MATFTLNSRIKIGAYRPFSALNDLSIRKSLNNTLETAVFKIPASAVLKNNATGQSQKVDTARQFKKGDKIVIDLGYNGDLKQEFEGFVVAVNKSIPCVIECEGYAFQLHDKSISKVYRKVSIRRVLTDLIEGTEIILGDIQDIQIDKLDYIKFNRYQALSKLKSDLGNAVSFWMDGKVLHCGLKYFHFSEKNKSWRPDVTFRTGYNYVREGLLKERLAGDNNREILIELKRPNGKKETVKAGVVNSATEKKKIGLLAADNKSDAKKIAEELSKEKNYTGVEGEITGFLKPFVTRGMKLRLIDDRYPELSGDYLVEEVETTFGMSGARRKIKLSFKL